MNIDSAMLRWSQTVYGVAQSLHIARSVKLGNLTDLVDTLSDAERWNKSSLGFSSILPSRDFREGSINLDGRDHEEVFEILSENIVKFLFVNLAVFADECLGQLINDAGVTPPNFLTSKIEWVKSRIDVKYEWAANGLLEFAAIRNTIVHGEGRLNDNSIEILGKAGVCDAIPDYKISLSFGDLFRYRRALRTVMGELQKMKSQNSRSKTLNIE